MTTRNALHRIADALYDSEFERSLRRAARGDNPAFLFGWNRGLGDVAFALVPFFLRIREAFPQARIAAITRPDLAEMFELAGADEIHVVAGLARGQPLDVEAEAQRLALDLSRYTGVFGNPDVRRWRRHASKQITLRLQWQHRFDFLAERFPEIEADVPWVGIHVNSETRRFYHYNKDWPIERWAQLFARVRSEVPAHFVLFGSLPRADSLSDEGVLDLRGQLTLLEVLAILRTRCRALVAPDSGILSIAYLLDAQFDFDVVSLWADPRQGILKHKLPSPNAHLRHVPIVARYENVDNITVEEVALPLLRCLVQPAPSA